MQYTVPVYFQVNGDNAVEAEQKVTARLQGHKLGYDFTVCEAEASNLPNDLKISLELRNFLHAMIETNEQDIEGWNTNLNYVKKNLDDMDDDDVIHYCGSILLPDIRLELNILVNTLGGTTQAGNLVEWFDKNV